LILSSLLLTYSGSLWSIGNYLPGSRFAGMANASVMLPDIWSVAHNQAGLAWLDHTVFSVHHENKFVVPQYGLNAVALSIPTKRGTLGLSYYYFGYSRYHESKTGLAYSKMFGDIFSAGVQINYHSIFISQDYGRSSAVSVEAGIMAQPLKHLYIGAHVFNPSGSGFNTPEGRDDLPVVFRFGMGYHFFNRMWLTMESEKESGIKTEMKIGLEVEAANHLFLRGGLSTDPGMNTFGLGYRLLGFRGDLAFNFHPVLGFTPHFTLTFTFR